MTERLGRQVAKKRQFVALRSIQGIVSHAVHSLPRKPPRPVLQGLRQVGDADVVGGVKVGDGAGNF